MFYKSRSKFTDKVTCLKSMELLKRSGHKPNMNTQSLTVRKLWPMFKSRSKVTGSKFMVPLERPCHKEHICQI